MGLYPNIPHNVGLRSLKEARDKREQKKLLQRTSWQMAEFVSKNNFFEFNNQIKQRISGTAVGTTCAPTYACVLTDKVKKEFLKT